MYRLIGDLRVVEAASFIAGPSCGLHLAQLGAEVIRIDPVGGGPDRNRWPKSAAGESLYWEGLNKGKKSVVIDLARPEGRRLAQRLVAAEGAGAGLLVTNFPAGGFLGHAALRELRADLISLRISGWCDGSTAVDYTVNAALGVPLMTGPAEMSADQPVNAVLPAWDLLAGAYGAFTLLAAERSRRDTGRGGEVRLPLGGLAAATLGHLGQLAEVLASGSDRPRTGNDLFGAFGRDFQTADGKRLMVVAITGRQWTDLLSALGIEGEVREIESEVGLSFASDEGLRYLHRQRLWPVFDRAFRMRRLDELTARFEGTGVCWAPYRTLLEAVESGDRFSAVTPDMVRVEHPSGTYPTPGAAAEFTADTRVPPAPAPRLGQHTEEVLDTVLRLPRREIARLRDEGLVKS